ncbi:hypothetical protein A3F08_02900 [Candidatus Berkelbacteria bacterium RIFCSPHIGHO2_12_FULL_36_9]|uniref:Uncharacterized protein n=1 Tax=Candidatus Berkelbacteria bacterium RIFCSPHIGHO2_12_FULL_36_9 TaxID=1797469 RepID=A0A1F5EKA8_9BACT|nr:MAG: hypothetical protein A3F08_02900 [Candidatus Berkelbacteria bacterium RIFCSPHIGHO2_12_FULL_36_9]
MGLICDCCLYKSFKEDETTGDDNDNNEEDDESDDYDEDEDDYDEDDEGEDDEEDEEDKESKLCNSCGAMIDEVCPNCARPVCTYCDYFIDDCGWESHDKGCKLCSSACLYYWNTYSIDGKGSVCRYCEPCISCGTITGKKCPNCSEPACAECWVDSCTGVMDKGCKNCSSSCGLGLGYRIDGGGGTCFDCDSD